MVRPKSVGERGFLGGHSSGLILLVGLGLMMLRVGAREPLGGCLRKESVTKQLLRYVPANGRITLKKTVPMSRLKLDRIPVRPGRPNPAAQSSFSTCRESELGERIQVACRGRQVGSAFSPLFKVVLRGGGT